MTFYRLYELAKQSPSSRANRDAVLETSTDGQVALAVAWSRKFRTHDLLEVAESGDVYSDYYTELFGTLVWRDSSAFIGSVQATNKTMYFQTHLAGRPVLDTLQRGIAALLAIT